MTDPTGETTPSASALEGRTLGDFVLHNKLGEGGAGVVYRATQPMLGREAVIKVLLAKNRGVDEITQRFLREARVASKIDHPYAAHIYAFGAEPDGLLWIAMELVRGTPLDQLLLNQGPIPLVKFVPLLERLCEVIHTVHEQSIVHRDIKPANVMVISRAGKLLPKLLDLGIAKLKELPQGGQSASAADFNLESSSLARPVTGTTSLGLEGLVADLTRAETMHVTSQKGEVIGSPHYMSPEQWEGAATVDRRADIYSLGVLSFQCLTGKLPFEADSMHRLAKLHLTQPPPPLGLEYPPALSDALARAMAKKAADRYETALEMAAAIRASSGLLDEPLQLPELEPGVRQEVVSGAPQSIAETVTLLEAARSVKQAYGAVAQVRLAVAQYLGLLALAHRTRQDAGTADAVEVTELLQALRKEGLSSRQWLALARALSQPFASRSDSHPLPELVRFFFDPLGRAQAAVDAFDIDLARERSDSAEQMLIELTQGLPRLADLFRALTFLFEYPLVCFTGGIAERWMGLRRPKRTQAQIRGDALADGMLAIVDPDGVPVLRLNPLVQAIAPTPGAPPELFFLSGNGRHGALLTALPLGFERQDESLWEWLQKTVPGIGTEAKHQTIEGKAPFMGLASFSSEDRDNFFGREREAEAFANRLRSQSLLAIVGPSGVGKSSFVQAGVLPLLPDSWRAITVRPGRTPLAAFAARLAQLGGDCGDLRQRLKAGEDALGGALRALGAREKQTVMLVVDQFEELVTLCLDEEERNLYAEGLVRAAGSAEQPTRVVLTLRDDFLIRTQQISALRERIAPGLQLLGTPGTDDLMRIITEPVKRVGYAFDDPELPRRMVEEVRAQPGALALLSFTATKLWEMREQHFQRLTRKAYQALGGVGGALAHHAEATLEAMPEDQQKRVREAFRHLVSASGTRAVLNRKEMFELLGRDASAEAVIERLIASRLLVASEGADNEDRVEVIHEALLGSWPRLVKWQREDAESARMRDQLRAAARQWHDRGRVKGVLWRGEALMEYRLWRARFPGAMTDLEASFAKASLQEETSGRRFRQGALALSFIVLAVGMFVLYRANIRAEKNAVQAQRSATEARQGIALLHEEKGRLLFLAGQPLQALVYLSKALTEGDDGAGIRYLIARASASARAELMSLEEGTATLLGVAVSPDDKWIVTDGQDKRLQLWNAETGALLRTMNGHTDRISSLQFNEKGDRLLTASDDGTARVWAIPGGELQLTLTNSKAPVVTAEFSRDEKLIVTSSNDKHARVWDAASGALRQVLGPLADEVGVARFSPDGQLVATAVGPVFAPYRSDAAVHLWRVSDGKMIGALQGHRGGVSSAAFDPSGARLVTGSQDRTAVIWDVSSRRALFTLEGHLAPVRTVAWSPDGTEVGTTSFDGTGRLWDARTGKLLVSLTGHDGPLRGGLFSPTGDQFLTTGDDATARLWDAHTGQLLMKYIGHYESIRGSAFLRDGKKLITAGDVSAKVWDRSARLQLAPLAEAKGASYVEFSPDSKRARGATDGRALREWDAATGALISTYLWPDAAPAIPSWSEDGTMVATEGAEGDYTPRIWEYPSGRLLMKLPGHTARVTGVSLGPRRQVLTFSDDGTARLWDLGTGKLRFTLRHPDTLVWASFSPSGDQVATGCALDPIVRLWSTLTGKLEKELKGHTLGVNDLRYSKDGRQLITGSADTTARVWDLASGATTTTLRGHRSFVNSAVFSPDGLLAVTASSDGTAKVWDARSGVVLDSLSLNGPVSSVAFDGSGTHIVTVGPEERATFLWDAARDLRSAEELATYVSCRIPLRLVGTQLVNTRRDREACRITRSQEPEPRK